MLKRITSRLHMTDVLGDGGASLISEAVREAEMHTSGEIVVRVVQSAAEPSTRAAAVAEFERLGMRNTQLRNGILLFIALDEHAIELVADDGIAALVPQQNWDGVVDIIGLGFRTSFATEAIVMAVTKMGDLLGSHFAFCASDLNELPNDVCSG